MNKLFFMRLINFLIVFFFTPLVMQAGDNNRLPQETDSLKRMLLYVKNDSIKIEILDKLAFDLSVSEPLLAHQYAQEALKIAASKRLLSVEARIFGTLSRIYRAQSDYQDALAYAIKSLEFYEKIKNTKEITAVTNAIGIIYRLQGQPEKALGYHLQAYKMAEKEQDSLGLAWSLNNIGNIHYIKKDYAIALDYHLQALRIRKKINDLEGMAASYNNLGIMHSRLDNYDEALEYYYQSLPITLQRKEFSVVSAVYDNIGDIYLKQKYYDSARINLEKGLEFAKMVKAKNRLMESYQSFSEFYKAKHDYENALLFYQKSMALKDSIFSEENAKRIVALQQTYDIRKKESEIVLLNKTRQAQQNALYGLSGSLLLVILLAFGLYKNNTRNQKINYLLRKQQQVIAEKNRELHLQHLQISASIQAAKAIQQSILPTKEQMTFLTDYFVLNRAKDVVSGDLYWLHQLDDKSYLVALLDCTGHGVPGALMSMVGDTLLDKIVKLEKIYSPEAILQELHDEIKILLHQDDDSRATYGMDACICWIEKTDHGRVKIKFSGAKRPLYYIEAEERVTEELKGDRKTVGGTATEDLIFTNQEIVLENGDMIYLSSDGLIDQNDHNRRRFGTKNLKTLLENNSHLSCIEQLYALENALDKHQTKTVQRDDILILGIRI